MLLIKMGKGKKLFLVILLVSSFFSMPCILHGKSKIDDAKKNIEDALWKDTVAAFENGSFDDSLRLLRLCLIGDIETRQAEKMMVSLLASAAADLIDNRELSKLSDSEIDSVFNFYREIASLKNSETEDWLRLLKVTLLMKKDDQFILSGLAFLDRIDQGMPVKPVDEFIDLVKRLEAKLIKDEQVLYRLQISRIFSSIEQTADEYATKLPSAQLEAEAKAIKILGMAEVAIAVGELDTAKRYLDQVRAFDKNYSGLAELYKKIEQTHRIHKMLAEASDAMRNKQFEDAVKLCNDVLKIDADNIFATNMLQQIKDASERKSDNTGSAGDIVALKVRRLESDLRKAEKEQDYSQIRQLLKELLMLKSDLPEHRQRLQEIEKEITLSRLHADERFKIAVGLYKREEYQQLRFFLNRNPGLMSSMERLFEIWEMRLMANFHTGHLEPVQLRDSASDLKKKSQNSFAASYVLMRLALAENRLEEARGHYNDARKIDARFIGLKWPGWILWMHGEGRPLVVIVVIVLLFLLVNLIRPAFGWFESTYWRRTAMLAKIFPSLALKSLEGCFGVVKDGPEREKLFRMLISCSISCKDNVKAKKYAENLLEMKGEDSQALDVLVPEWLKNAEVSDEKLLIICGYCVKNHEQKNLVEKAGVLLKGSNKIEAGHIEFLKHYIRHVPDDIEMMDLAGKSLLEIPVLEMPESAIAMIDTAWRRTDSDELWWSLWRTLMFCGSFDQAIQITLEVLEKRKPVLPKALLEVFDRYVAGELRHVVDLMSVYDEKKVLEAVKAVRKFRYFNEKMAEEALQIVDSLAREENHQLANAAKESADHIRARSKLSIIAVNKLLAMDVAADIKPLSVDDGQADNNAYCNDENSNDAISTSEENFSFEAINAAANSEEDVFSVSDLISSAGSFEDNDDFEQDSAEEALAENGLKEINNELSVRNDEIETLRISSEQVRISQTRQRLFAELDSLQPLNEPSDDWKNYSKSPVKNNGLFAALDN